MVHKIIAHMAKDVFESTAVLFYVSFVHRHKFCWLKLYGVLYKLTLL